MCLISAPIQIWALSWCVPELLRAMHRQWHCLEMFFNSFPLHVNNIHACQGMKKTDRETHFNCSKLITIKPRDAGSWQCFVVALEIISLSALQVWQAGEKVEKRFFFYDYFTDRKVSRKLGLLFFTRLKIYSLNYLEHWLCKFLSPWPWKLTNEFNVRSKNCPTCAPKNEKCEWETLTESSVSRQIDKRTLQVEDP